MSEISVTIVTRGLGRAVVVQVGCNVASKGGLSAPLHSIMTLTDLNVFTSNPPSERFAIFLNGTLFDTDNINSLEGSGGMAGMIVSPDGPPPKGFSPAPKDDFNKFGNALNMRKFDYPRARAPCICLLEICRSCSGIRW